MFVELSGNGPPLLLIHGWAMHAGIFASVLPMLAEQFTVHAVDLPGHGRSADEPFELETTLATLRQYLQGLPPTVVVGWSLGGTLAAELALSAPENVRALLCIASSPKFVASEDWPFGMASNHFERFSTDLQRDWKSVVDRFLALEVFGSADEKTELRWLREHVYAHGLPHPKALQSGLEMLSAIDLRGLLPGLNVPNMWLGGKRDRIVPPQALQCAAELGRGQARIIERAAHAPFLTHPEHIAQALQDLLGYSAI